MSDTTTYMVTITTLYRVHAKDKDHAVSTVRETVRGGIFHDNIVIVDQQALMYESPGGHRDISAEPERFWLGNEQLG